MSKGEHDSAIRLCMEVIRLAPKSPDAFKTLGMISQQMGMLNFYDWKIFVTLFFCSIYFLCIFSFLFLKILILCHWTTIWFLNAVHVSAFDVMICMAFIWCTQLVAQLLTYRDYL